MLLSSDDPKRLAAWYADAFEAEPLPVPGAPEGAGYTVIDLDGFFIMFDTRDDISGRNPQAARAILNVEVDDPQATAARLDALGAEWVSPLEDRDGNFFGTVADPDGNWLQILRLSDEHEAQMSGPTSAYSGFSVSDVDAAETFYRDVLGMRVLRFPMGQGPMGQGHLLGIRINRSTTVLAYPKPDHTPASYTILNVPVADLPKSVDEFTGKGVEFLRYDGFDHDERGIVYGNGYGPDNAWFTDPSGNVIALQQK